MTDTVHATVPATARVSDAYRWTQLAIGVGAMVMIANYQYGWTFFVPDIQKKFGWDRASIQWAFTLFVLFETWLVPIEGWFVDKYGPRLVVLIGGILCAIGWAINAEATSLNGYYLGMIIAWIGATVSAEPAPNPAAVMPAARPRLSGHHFSALPTQVP